jgi:hypothetical protein
MNSSIYHRIRDLVVELYAYVVHTNLSLVIEVVLDTQLRLMCNSLMTLFHLSWAW